MDSDGCGHVIMASGDVAELGRFHLKCSNRVSLSEDRKTAWTDCISNFGIAFLKETIPRERRFSVKVVEPADFNSFWVT